MKIIFDPRWLKRNRCFIFCGSPCLFLAFGYFSQHLIREEPSSAEIRLFFYFSITKTGRKMTVIQNPYFHISFSCFIQNDVHVVPPSGPGKIRMRPALNADRANICIIDHLHIFPQHGLLLPMLPEKRKNIIFHMSIQ